MLLLIINPNPPVRTDYDRGFDLGASMGMFDACNDRDIRDFSGVEETDYNAGYIEGYANGWAAYC